MFPADVKKEEIQAEKTEEGLLIQYEYKLTLSPGLIFALRIFFAIWNLVIGLFAIFGIGIVIYALFSNIKVNDILSFLLVFSGWFVMLYFFFRIGRNMSNGLSGKKPFMGWKLTIKADGWHSVFHEFWRHHDKEISIESIKQVQFDPQSRVIAVTPGKRIPLTTPLSEEARDWMTEKLQGFLSMSTTSEAE